ncbi:hypothetical protein BZG19_02020 [Salinivibrio kushneri]|jgi:hypothetical protein|nr:hypothetical protein BZG19_02020 [Salinivibrio kushneri]
MTMYHYIYDTESGDVLQVVNSPSFNFNKYQSFYQSVGLSVGVLARPQNIGTRLVVSNGELRDRDDNDQR